MIALFHANGYPSAIYQQFSDALAQRMGEPVLAPACLSDDMERVAPTEHWPEMQGRLLAFLAEHPAKEICLVGHSMGGYLSLMAASELLKTNTRPKLKLVLIDSPLVYGWRAGVFNFALFCGLNYKLGPAPIALRRRDSWPDKRAAKEFFAKKAFIQRWEHGVLDSFIEHGTTAQDNECVLRIPKLTEAHIYANLPVTRAAKALETLQAANIPVHFIAGDTSDEMRMAGRANNRKVFKQRIHHLPLGHLMPFDAPLICAEKVAALLRAEPSK